MGSTPIPMETLLAHREWVRRVALALVGDENLAADLEQDLWVKTIEKPPVVRGSVRGWIAAALRNRLIDGRRSESRRRRRETAVARPERQRSTEDLVAEAEGLKRVVVAVMDIPEPYRTTVLLRYFEDLPPAGIAARQGIPVETVRTRLKRAITLLRERFDSESRGDRKAWCLALLPLARRPEAAVPGMGTAVAVGGILMAKKAVAAAVVLLLLAGGGLLWWGGEEPPSPPGGRPRAGIDGSAGARAAPSLPAAPTVPAAPPKPAAVRGSRRVAWPVVPGECPVPPDGTVIPLRPIPGSNENEKDPPPGRMVGADLVVENLPDEMFWNAIAVGPDGALARLFVDTEADRGRETSFRKGRRLDVVLREEDGSPVAGAWVELRESGNNRLVPPGRTDAAGKVLFEGLPAYRANLLLVPGETPHALGLLLGVADLETGDGNLEVTLRAAVRLDLRVKVDGKAVLPVGLGASFDGALELQRKDDPEALLVRYLLRPAVRNPVLAVRAGATGYRPGRAVAEWREAEGTFVAEVDLERAGGRIVIHALAPPEMRFDWELRRLDAPRGGLQFAASSVFFLADRKPAFGPPGNMTIPDLAPGRYQFVTDSGLATEVIELGEGDEVREVSLDASKTAWVKGRIEAPSGADLRRAHVVIEGEGLVEPARGGLVLSSPGPGRPVAADGGFRVRVPGDRQVRVRAWHPSLVPAASGGAVEVTGAQEGIVLRLVEGAYAVLRLDPDRERGPRIETRRVLLFRGEPAGTPVSEHLLESGEDGLRFGGYAPGSYTLVVDVGGSWGSEDPGFAPKVVRDVKLGTGAMALGTIRLDEGASVRLELLLPEGAALPQLFMNAEALGGFTHRRGLNFYGKGDCVLKGLGKGRYRVSVSSGSPMTVLLSRDVESDGVGEIPLTLDLR